MSKWCELKSLEEEQYAEERFRFYRENGFPYHPTERSWRYKEYMKLMNYDYRKCIDESTKSIKQSMHGLSLAWSYFPHHYEIRCGAMKTVMEAFEDDDMLNKAIRKHIRIRGGVCSDAAIRRMLKIMSGVQGVSNFRPTAAAAIYERFAPDYGTVYDMSAGFGGRMLGAHIANCKYIGVDPSTRTYEGLVRFAQDFDIDATLFNQGSEERLPVDDGVIDLCFTSPPYFDCEKYAEEETQSYIKYPTQKSWIDGFMRDTITECHRVLKSKGTMLINIAPVKSFPNVVEEVVRVGNECGFKHKDTWNLLLSPGLNTGRTGMKQEPILIFERY